MTVVIESLFEVLESTLPVLVLVFVFQLFILRKKPNNLRTILVGIAMALVGFVLFILGARMSMIPMGMRIGEYLANLHPTLVIGFVFIVGFVLMIAEPAVRILAFEIEEASAGTFRKRFVVLAVALGVGFSLILAWLRISMDFSLFYIFAPGYLLILLLTFLSPAKAVPLAFDAGAVATGPVAVNFLLPMTTGMAISLWGEQAGILGFGVVGIIAMCPIISMLILGIILNRRRYE
jgi:hypothetical protein